MAISFDAKLNFSYSVVAVAPAPAASGTSLQVAAGDGAKFPAVPFNAVIWPTGVQPTTANAEIVRVTAKATDTFTITRAQESSSARTVIVNDQIALNITRKTLTDIEAAFSTASQLTSPIGSVMMWFTGTAPTGWLLLQGQAISRTTYASLFTLWGTTFGAGDGSTTFNVPDMRSRLPIGLGVSSPLNALGNTSGSWDHTHGAGSLTVASHTHGAGTLTVESHTHAAGTLTAAAHTHGAGTLGVASHDHSAGSYSAASAGAHTHTGTTTSDGAHTHQINSGVTVDAGAANNVAFSDVNSSSNGAHTHTFTTASDGAHTHTISGSAGAASPAVDSGLTGSTAPAVNSGATAGTAPAVTGGATAATAPAVSSGATAAANPPILVVNFIARALLEI